MNDAIASSVIQLESQWKPYPAYKDSGVEWLGEIPAHWEVKKIKRLCLIKRGASPRPIDDPIYFDDEGEYSWVRISDVTASTRYLLTTTQRLSELGQSRSICLEPGDIFLSIAATVGKPIITKIKCCIHDGFVYFVGLKEYREYLYYIFLGGELYKGLGKIGTQLNLNTDTIGDIRIPVPPQEEQRAIVNFLDYETTKIDALIAKKERLIELLTEKRTALISYAVTKGLDPAVPMKDSGVEWIGEIPAHWVVKRNKAIFREHDLRSVSGAEELLTVSHITGVTRRSEKTVNMIEAESHEGYKLCESGDLIINTMWAWMGALGVARETGMISPSYNVYRPIDSHLCPRYFDYVCRIPVHISELTRYSKGIWKSRLRLYPDEFLLICTALPNPAEQRDIADFLDCETARIDALIDKIQQHIEKFKEYRTAIISATVTGKIDVREEINNGHLRTQL
jgi:type I restriction enzyme, S subunit